MSDDLEARIAAWVDKYYRKNRMAAPGLRELIIASRVDDVRKLGWTVITHHDARTGEDEIFPPLEEGQQ